MIATVPSKKKKKDVNRGENAANKRWGKINLDDLREQKKRLELLLERFRHMETAIQAFRFENEEIRVDGVTKFERAYDELETYIGNVQKGIQIHRHGEVY